MTPRRLFIIIFVLLSNRASDAGNIKSLLVLSTGDQFKLYPLLHKQDGGIVPDSDRYLALKFDTSSKQLASSKQPNLGDNLSVFQPTENFAARIIQVDYFLNLAFCDLPSNDPSARCLVLIWHNAASRSINYGSVALNDAVKWNDHESDESEPLVLNIFRKIKVSELPGCSAATTVEALAMDRLTNTLHLMTHNNGTDRRIVSDRFEIDATDGIQFKYQTSVPLGPACSNFRETSRISQLNIHQNSSLSISYLEKFDDGARLVFVDLESEEPEQVCTGSKVKTFGPRFSSLDGNINSSIRAMMALDNSDQFLWFSTENQIFASNFHDSRETLLLANLTTRPTIRSIHSMHLAQDTLFMSDPLKRSLVRYQLNQRPRTDLDTEPTHQVVLVELSGPYGFQLIDLYQDAYLDRNLASHRSLSSNYSCLVSYLNHPIRLVLILSIVTSLVVFIILALVLVGRKMTRVFKSDTAKLRFTNEDSCDA